MRIVMRLLAWLLALFRWAARSVSEAFGWRPPPLRETTDNTKHLSKSTNIDLGAAEARWKRADAVTLILSDPTGLLFAKPLAAGGTAG